MVSIQRRRGEDVVIFPEKEVTDERGTKKYVPDMDNGIPTRGFLSSRRGGKAEVAGQQTIEVYTLIIPADLGNFTIRSRVFWRGLYWDVVTPPERHRGTRQSRHWSMDLRRRPSDG